MDTDTEKEIESHMSMLGWTGSTFYHYGGDESLNDLLESLRAIYESINRPLEPII